MEVTVPLLVAGALFGFIAYRMNRRHAIELLSAQDKCSALEIAESQLRQKNQLLTDELTAAKQGYQEVQQKLEALSMELSQHMSAEREARTILDTLSEQLSRETNQRATVEEQLHSARQMVNAASAQLRTTVEERMRELQLLQQQLHNESAARKQLEELLSGKEEQSSALAASLQHTEEQLRRATDSLSATSAELHAAVEERERTIAVLRADIEERGRREAADRHSIADHLASIDSLRAEVASLSEDLYRSRAANDVAARERTTAERELVEKIARLETDFASLSAVHTQVSDALKEETAVRIATEHALHESKERLYALIHELEAKVGARDAIIDSQNDHRRRLDRTVNDLNRTVEAVLTHVPVPLFVVNTEGLCGFANPALHTALGYSAEELRGRHFSLLFPETERPFYEEQWSAAGDKAAQFQGETHVATAAGDTMSADVSVIPIDTEAGRNYVGCILDTTHEREAERHHAEAKRRDDELKELKSRFIAMVTDQLRAALVTVGTNTELLERFLFKWNDEKRYRAFFRINESLKRMLDLLRDVETSTAAVSTFTPAPAPVDLESLAQSVAKEVQTDLGCAHRFVLSEQGDIAAVPLDERVVRTVLQQTLSNAFKFSPESAEVRLHIDRSDSRCTITVKDAGIGIPAAEQRHLFTSFFRGSNVGAVYGTGLGLTIARQFVQLAGGTIAVESAVNSGTTVTVSLPVNGR